MVNIGTKACTQCEQTKSITEFYRQAKAPDGYQYKCKSCANNQTNAIYNNNRENDRWIGSIKGGYRRAGKYPGCPRDKFTSRELIEHWESIGISPDHSVYTGEPLGDIAESSHVLEHVISLSVEGGPGHVLSNVVPALQHENSIKRDKNIVDALLAIHQGRDVPAPPEGTLGTVVTVWGPPANRGEPPVHPADV